jgi:hypothetical protein
MLGRILPVCQGRKLMPYIQYDPKLDTTFVGTYNADGEFVIDDHDWILRTHAKDKCAGEWCSIHNPNPLWDFGRLFWREDRGIMERICQHGVGHPTKESWAFYVSIGGYQLAANEFVHGCDRCCM